MAEKAEERLSWREFFLSLSRSLAALSAVFFVSIGLIVFADAGYQIVFSDDPVTSEQFASRLVGSAEGAVGLAVLWTLFAGVRLLLDPEESPWRDRRVPHRSGPTIRGFFKTVLFAGIPFGVLLALVGADSLTEFVGTVILAGPLFGISLGTLLSVLQWWMSRRSRASGGLVQPRARTQGSVVVRLPLSATYRKCFDMAIAVFGPGTVRADGDSPTIRVQTGMSWKSWGEQVILQLSRDDAATTTVSITSRPKVRTTIFDYGKNRQNVDRVANWLTSETDDDRYRDWRRNFLAQLGHEPPEHRQ